MSSEGSNATDITAAFASTNAQAAFKDKFKLVSFVPLSLSRLLQVISAECLRMDTILITLLLA